MLSATIAIMLGLLVGLRHVFEPDHLTAVSTLIGETRSPRHGAVLGALWGLGHTISLLLVGVTLIVVGAALPARAGAAFELCVAGMLLLLGSRSLLAAVRGPGRGQSSSPQRWRPLMVGLVHGLAGSGALTALVFAQLPGTTARIVYMVLFGAGSVAGMATASGVAGATMHLFASSEQTRRAIGVATGILSMTVGVLWSIPQLR